jgi:hypothetical protein
VIPGFAKGGESDRSLFAAARLLRAGNSVAPHLHAQYIGNAG